MRLHSLRGTGWVSAIATLGLMAGCVGSPPATNQNAIGAQGGTVALQAGAASGTTIVVPAGALSTSAVITIREGSDPTDLPSDAGGSAGPLVVFGPEGQQFAAPVAITLIATDTAETIYTRPVGGTTWTEVDDATYDAARHVITGHVAHFSEFVAGHHHHRHPTACMADSDCAMGQVCIAGACAATGTDAGVPDSGRCASDSDCARGDACVMGACVPSAHDGGMSPACASDSDCVMGDVCVAGACVAGGHDGGMSPACVADSDCAMGDACLMGACVPSAHDGGTGVACMTDSDCTASGERCVGGRCAGATCAMGETLCAMVCVDLASDARNCGACGTACAMGTHCTAGACR